MCGFFCLSFTFSTFFLSLSSHSHLHPLSCLVSLLFLSHTLLIQSNSVITNSSGPAIFARYNRVNLCSKMTNLPSKFVRYNRVFINNRVRYNRVSLYTFLSLSPFFSLILFFSFPLSLPSFPFPYECENDKSRRAISFFTTAYITRHTYRFSHPWSNSIRSISYRLTIAITIIITIQHWHIVFGFLEGFF